MLMFYLLACSVHLDFQTFCRFVVVKLEHFNLLTFRVLLSLLRVLRELKVL